MLFPEGTKTVSIDEHGSTLSGVMIPTSTNDITVLYCRISQSGNADSHISIDVTSTGRTLCDTEGNNVIDSFAPIVVPAGHSVVWDKGLNNTRYAGQVSYVDYNISSSSPSPTSTGVDYTKDINIGIILLIVIAFTLGLDFFIKFSNYKRI